MKFIKGIILSFLWITFRLEAQEVIPISTDFKVQLVDDKMVQIADYQNISNIDSLLNTPDLPFQKPNEFTKLNYGLTQQNHWLKFILQNQSESKELQLELVNPYLEELILFTCENNKCIKIDTLGANFIKTEKENRNYVFNLKMEKKQTICYYLWIKKSISAQNFYVLLWEKSARSKYSLTEGIVIAVFFSLSIVFLFVLGFTFFMEKLRHTAYFFLFMFFALCFIFIDLGLWVKLLGVYFPNFQLTASAIVSNIFLITTTLFIQAHFDTSRENSIFHRFLNLTIVSSLVLMLIGMIALECFSGELNFIQNLYKTQVALNLITCLSVYYICNYQFFIKKNRGEVFWFLSGFFLLGIGLMIMIFQRLGYIPQNIFINEFLQKPIFPFFPITFYLNPLVMIGLLIQFVSIFTIILKRMNRLYLNNIQLINDLVLTAENERQRIGEELHDGLGIQLSTLKIRLSLLQNNENWKKEILFLMSELDNTHDDMRSIASNIATKTLRELGLSDAIEELYQRIENAHKPLIINYFCNAKLEIISPVFQINIYRITQELLNNIVKHARASEVNLQFIEMDNTLIISIDDNGVGFNEQEAIKKGNIGLNSVQRRVAAMEGKLYMDSQIGNGTVITIEIDKKRIQ